MKVLIVEDDQHIIAGLRRGLHASFLVDTAKTGADAIHDVEATEYDAVVLDLNLPDMHGLDVCRALRKLPKSPPILILTGNSNVRDKVTLLDAGADDYLTKPFSIEELKARLRVLVRRDSHSRTSLLRVGDLVLDTATRFVERQEQPIHLRRKEFDLLEYLMHHPGKVITRAMIIDHVWDMNENLWTNAVDVHIKYLRDKIDRPFDSAMIKTIHGIGYKLEATKRVAVPR